MSADSSIFHDALARWSPQRLLALNHDGASDRAAHLVHHIAGIRFDWTKTHLDSAALAIFQQHALGSGFDAARRALFAGEAVNTTEGRAAEHSAQRGVGQEDAVKLAAALHERMRALIDVIDMGGFGEITHILHIGIGGSALGPQLLIDALGRDEPNYHVEVVSNVDGSALKSAITRLDPQRTLVAIASKTFTTTETLLNAETALAWLREAGVEDAMGRVVALTAMPDRAMAWGIDETRILPFPESVGGRYSLWSSIGFPAAAALGWAAFSDMLAGAAEMDRHFRDAPMESNIPLLAAFVDQLYSQHFGSETRAIFAYDERLRLLPPYLQQLEMESNGKSVRKDGQALHVPSAAISWGGVGTDAQHAVFQLLHQGTRFVPVEFVASIEAGHDFDPAHHRMLIGNCIAQGAALMAGQASPDDPARNYPGNRPSTTLLLGDVTPYTLGALIAFYEHRTFANAVLLGINPFDQFGVELGKQMAKAIDDPGDKMFDPSTTALLQAAFGGA